VIIIDGLKNGEKVVVAGNQLLHPDMQVELVNAYKNLTGEAQ
jgi:hypothetical protein